MPAPNGLVDPRVPRFNQGVTGSLLLLAFVADAPWLVPVLGVVLGAGALLGPRWNLWGQIFLRGVKPALRLAPPSKLKDAAPPRFAMTIGFVFLAVATVAFYAMASPLGAYVGWGLAIVVSALALLAAATDVCVGCEIYVLVARLRGARAA